MIPGKALPLALFTGVVHGFRTPLFFLLSGYFTMLLISQAGLKALLCSTRPSNLVSLPCRPDHDHAAHANGLGVGDPNLRPADREG